MPNIKSQADAERIAIEAVVKEFKIIPTVKRVGVEKDVWHIHLLEYGKPNVDGGRYFDVEIDSKDGEIKKIFSGGGS